MGNRNLYGIKRFAFLGCALIAGCTINHDAPGNFFISDRDKPNVGIFLTSPRDTMVGPFGLGVVYRDAHGSYDYIDIKLDTATGHSDSAVDFERTGISGDTSFYRIDLTAIGGKRTLKVMAEDYSRNLTEKSLEVFSLPQVGCVENPSVDFVNLEKILRDPSGLLWLMYRNGFATMDMATLTWKPIETQKDKAYLSFAIDPQGRVSALVTDLGTDWPEPAHLITLDRNGRLDSLPLSSIFKTLGLPGHQAFIFGGFGYDSSGALWGSWTDTGFGPDKHAGYFSHRLGDTAWNAVEDTAGPFQFARDGNSRFWKRKGDSLFFRAGDTWQYAPVPWQGRQKAKRLFIGLDGAARVHATPAHFYKWDGAAWRSEIARDSLGEVGDCVHLPGGKDACVQLTGYNSGVTLYGENGPQTIRHPPPWTGLLANRGDSLVVFSSRGYCLFSENGLKP